LRVTLIVPVSILAGCSWQQTQSKVVAPPVKLAPTIIRDPASPPSLESLMGVDVSRRDGVVYINGYVPTEDGYDAYRPQLLATAISLDKKTQIFQMYSNGALASSQYHTIVRYNRSTKRIFIYHQSTMSGTVTSESRTVCEKVTDQVIFTAVKAKRASENYGDACQAVNIGNLRNKRK
jgi:hypothetical protein